MNPNSSPADRADHRALRESAVIGAISVRTQLGVAGPDRSSYLQGLLTNDIQVLQPGQGCYAAWLSPQGRMLTDMHVLQSETMILLDLPAEQAEAALARLDQFLFSEEVRLASLADTMTGVWLHGPQAAAVIEQAVEGMSGVAQWSDYQHAIGTFGAEPVSVARVDQLGVPGYCAFIARSAEERFVAACAVAGALVAGADVLHAARIEAGYPLFGVDMTTDTIPLEAGIEQRAISFTKGCFVGQEVVIRVLHRGGGRVARRLVGFTFAGPAIAGTKAYSGDREIGWLTSVAESATFGPIALGYVHRDFVTPGTRVELDVDHDRVAAVVTALPMAPPVS